mmetsp:Transcript_41812/g.110715  ORF Transcript_41812/g.110715 Transcript_41812/m.110715 type:complete len:401 (-) Transcript_41812:1014-2216(-)
MVLSSSSCAVLGSSHDLPFLPLARHLKYFQVLLLRFVVREDIVHVLLESILAVHTTRHSAPFLDTFRLTLLHQLDLFLLAKLLLDFEPVFQEHRTLLAAVLCFEVLHAPVQGNAAVLHGLRRSGLELRIGDEHTDVVGLTEKPLPHVPRTFKLLVTDLKVDIPLPHELGHVQSILLDRKLTECSGSLGLANRVFEIHVHSPSLRILTVQFQELPIDLSTPLHVSQAHLQISIVEEDAFLLALSNGPSKDATGTAELQLAHLKLCVKLPHFSEGELLVRHYLDHGVVHRPRLVDVPSLELFKERVVDPEVAVTSPESLLQHRRLVRNGSLVDLTDARDVSAALFELDVIEPRVVVPRVFLYHLLIDETSLVDHHFLDRIPVTVLLLKRHKTAVELVAGSLG